MAAHQLIKLRAALRPHRWELGVAALLVVAFALLATLTMLEAVSAWDTRVVIAVNDVAATHTALRVAATAVTTLGSPLSVDILTVAAVVAVWRYGVARAGRLGAILYLLAARLVELGLETGVKTLVDRPRPVVPHPFAVAADASFPSGHTAGTAVLCVAVVLLLRIRSGRPMRLWLVAVATTAVVAVAASRVLLGVHYPTDVVGGALLGVATALALVPVTVFGRSDNPAADGGERER